MRAYIGRPFLILALVILSLFLLFHRTQEPLKKSAPQSDVLSEVSAPGLPLRLVIPAINVNAAIEYVGVTQSGEMEVPGNTIDVGWFKLGSRPGEKGSAVIAGHFDAKDGAAAVFSNLNTLKEGDKLYIQDDKGASIAFVVRESRTYDPGYAEEVFSRNDTAHLNLITCDGAWDEGKKSYTKRLVVFADILSPLSESN